MKPIVAYIIACENNPDIRARKKALSFAQANGLFYKLVQPLSCILEEEKAKWPDSSSFSASKVTSIYMFHGRCKLFKYTSCLKLL